MIVPLPVAVRLFVFFLNHFGPLACVLSPPLLLLINSDSSQLFERNTQRPQVLLRANFLALFVMFCRSKFTLLLGTVYFPIPSPSFFINVTDLLCDIFWRRSRGDKRTSSPDASIMVTFLWNGAMSALFPSPAEDFLPKSPFLLLSTL